MAERVRLTELAAMNEEEQQTQVAALVRAQQAARQEGSPLLEARIRQFEARFDMSSEQLLELVRAGKHEDTAEINDWLGLLAAKGNGRTKPTNGLSDSR